MKKIGIITFHRPHNYGAALQAYAMKRIFSAYGDAELIDYWPSDHNRLYALFRLDFLDKSRSLRERAAYFKRFLGEMKNFRTRKAKAGKYQKFIANHLCSSGEGTFQDSSKLPQHYDAYVYGSDQIWRAFEWDKRNYPLPDLVYYGKGSPDTAFRMSYAASMGTLNADILRNPEVTNHLNKFDYLSTREGYLADFLRSHLSREVTQVLDPTFLISKEEWSRLADTNGFAKNAGYIVSYNLIGSRKTRALARRASRVLGIPSLEIAGGTYDPVDFLQMIRHAEFVICTSFHAVVFSLIFNKNFFVIGMGENSGRVSNLLSELSLQDRMIETPEAANFDEKIDYPPVMEKLERLVGVSRSFIARAMNDFLRR